jgi:hypothetical protein
MEFLDGNDCSGIALIGPIIYSNFLQFQLILQYSAVAILLGRNSAGLPEMSGWDATPPNTCCNT